MTSHEFYAAWFSVAILVESVWWLSGVVIDLVWTQNSGE